METFALGREVAYGALPAPDADVRGPAWKLDRAYVERAVRATATQLAKAGVRLADLLERALAPR
jgi:hypothetical protein